MRKRINSIFLAMLATFAFQGNISAQTENVVWENTFSTESVVNGWTEEGEFANFKSFLDYNGTYMFLDVDNFSNNGKTAYAVSPSFTLDAAGNEVTFNSKCYGFDMSPIADAVKLVIRETGSTAWTEITGIEYPTGNSIVNSGNLSIPADFNGKDVQVAFKLTGCTNSYQMYYVQDIKVTKVAGGNVDPSISEKILFDKSGDELFNATYNGFSIEGYKGLDDWQTVWNFNTWGGPFGINPSNIAVGDTNIETYFVTPVIRLHVNNKIEVGHTIQGYAAGEAEKHLALCIREEGSTTWENVEGVVFGEDGVELYTDFLNIDPKYNDKKVQFGFKYTAEDGTKAGIWYLSSIMVVGDAPDPVEAGISYDVTEFNYEIGSKDPFQAPVINNPNELKVTYSTSDYDIATVDSNTGEITIGGNKQGDVTITATTAECVEFLAGEASYTIHVVDPILVFKAPFTSDECGFKEETTTTSVWKFNYGNVAAQNPVESATTSYYVSPEIDLPAEGALVSFNHATQGIANLQEHAGISIREIGGEWKDLAIENWPKEDAFWWDFVATGDISVPAEFNGKKVQFGFRFKLDENTFAENVGNDWPNTKYVVNNFLVTKYINRAEAELSFDKPEYTYYMGEIAFESPVVNNPNELQVSYANDNESSEMIDINSATGEVNIKDEGTATIFARSTKNNEFKAGEASYKLNVIDPALIFRAKFGKSGLCNFTEEGSTGYWSFDGFVNTGACTNANDAEGTKGYLVSPEIELAESGNHVSWLENGYALDFETQAIFAVREVGGEWTEITAIDRSGEAVSGMTRVFCDIPGEFNGKTVQVALVFVNGEPTNWQSWNVNDLKIRKDFVKIDPSLAFDKAEAVYVHTEDFVAPVLSNPENVEVTYSSSDVLVATINEVTGVLEFIGDGMTVITASSKEDNMFLAGEASYQLTVSNLTGINGVSIDLNSAEIYDLQGNRIQNVVKGNVYIINGKKVLVK